MSKGALTFVVIAASFAGCKPKASETELSSVISADGSEAVGLVAGRRHFDRGFQSPKFENSIRLVLMPVVCSPAALKKLELLSALDPELVRHDGRRVVDYAGKAIPGAESCTLSGNYLLNAWSMQHFFATVPKTQAEFEDQQWMWLALRGAYDREDSRLPSGVARMLQEGGLYQGVPEAIQQAKIAKWDQFYNPCAVGNFAKKLGFERSKAFGCEDGSYALKKPVEMGARLSKLLEAATEDMLARIEDGEYSHLNTNGIEEAVMLDPKARKQGFALGSRGRRVVSSPGGSQSYQFSPVTSGLMTTTPRQVVTPNYSPTTQNGQVLTFQNDNAQYVSQDVTQLMRAQGNAGAGSQYRTEMQTGTNGQTYYVDHYANGSAAWYQRGPNGQGWSHLGTVGGPGGLNPNGPGVDQSTVVGRSPLQQSQTWQDWQSRDVTQQMQREGYSGFSASAQYVNARTGESSFLDRRQDGSYMWYTRNTDGSFQEQYGRDAQGRSVGPNEWNSQTGQWQARAGAVTPPVVTPPVVTPPVVTPPVVTPPVVTPPTVTPPTVTPPTVTPPSLTPANPVLYADASTPDAGVTTVASLDNFSAIEAQIPADSVTTAALDIGPSVAEMGGDQNLMSLTSDEL